MTILVATALEVYFGLTLLGAAIMKWSDGSPLLRGMARRWPALAGNVTSVVIGVEAAVGAALLVGTEPVAGLAGAAVFGSFLGYKAYLVIRHGADAQCSCRGVRRAVTASDLVTGSVQLGLAVGLTTLPGGSPGPVRVGFGAVALLAYLGAATRRRRASV